jgi:hypothetical protein
MAPNLTMIVSTFGRSTLRSVIRDIITQMKPGDQFIVSADGPCPTAKALVDECEGLVEYVDSTERSGDFGCTPNDRGMQHARGHAIWFLGDDDHYPPGSLNAIRAAVEKAPDVVHVFSMLHTGRKLGRSIALWQVSGQQIVVPNRPDLPLWKLFPPGHVNISDWHWIDRVITQIGRYMYHDYVVCVLSKQNYGAAL